MSYLMQEARASSRPGVRDWAASRRKSGCASRSGPGCECDTCRAGRQAREHNTSASGHGLGNVSILPGRGEMEEARASHAPGDQTGPAEVAGPEPASAEAEAPAQNAPAKAGGDLNFGEENNPASTSPVVGSVDLVTEESGAAKGYDEKLDTCKASLNIPGPFNDPVMGAVANVHQVHFQMSQGRAQDLRAKRIVNRTAVGRGKTWTKSGDDGPPSHEYHFANDRMVIADAPGWCSTLRESDFPVTYKADFSTYAFDPLTMKVVASISYRVEISKTHLSQRDPVNTATVTGRKIGGAVPSPVGDKK